MDTPSFPAAGKPLKRSTMVQLIKSVKSLKSVRGNKQTFRGRISTSANFKDFCNGFTTDGFNVTIKKPTFMWFGKAFERRGDVTVAITGGTLASPQYIIMMIAKNISGNPNTDITFMVQNSVPNPNNSSHWEVPLSSWFKNTTTNTLDLVEVCYIGTVILGGIIT